MKHYEFIYIETVNTKPFWDENQIGRLIYELSTNLIWLGAKSLSSSQDNSGWINISLGDNVIKSKHIDWDTNVDDLTEQKISSKSIPVSYPSILNNDTDVSIITNLQEVVNDVHAYCKKLSDGTAIKHNSITVDHLNLSPTDGLNASVIPFRVPEVASITNLQDFIMAMYYGKIRIHYDSGIIDLVQFIEEVRKQFKDFKDQLRVFENKHIPADIEELKLRLKRLEDKVI